MRFRARLVLIASLASGLLICGGCRTAPPIQTGVRIGDETLKQFKAGTTTESWLLAVLGPPTSSSEVANIDNTKVYRYALGEVSKSYVTVFGGETTVKNTAVVYFIITDGIVTRFWADRATEHTLFGKAVEDQSGEVQDTQ